MSDPPSNPAPPPPAWKRYALMLTCLAAYFAVTHFLFGTVSPTMYLFGVPCPGCGLTRAGVFFLRGNFADSLRMHPLLVPVAAYLAAMAFVWFFRPAKLKTLYPPGYVLLAAALGLYVYRMVVYFPHAAPMTLNENAMLQNLLNLIRERS